jgi:hypothetical protein
MNESSSTRHIFFHQRILNKSKNYHSINADKKIPFELGSVTKPGSERTLQVM